METKTKYILGITGLIVFLLLLAPFADPNPDGLESAVGNYNEPEGGALDLGFLTDYGAEGSILYELLGNETLAVIVSGIIGVLAVMSVFIIPIVIIRRRNTETVS
ncbi:MAG: PDGLE domain-containing protein [Candidatus Hodarchaeales archaeon]